MANLKTRCPKGESFPSVTPSFPGASIYERELVDLLGRAHRRACRRGRATRCPRTGPRGSTRS